MTRETFQPDLNVRRQEMVDTILAWLNEPNPEFRLRSIVGTAGIGKSWFMADLVHNLSSMDEFHVIWLDFSRRAIHPKSTEEHPDCLQENGRLTWLANIAQEANEKFRRNLFSLQPGIDFIPAFRSFVSEIGKQNPPTSILLVDGYDEIPPLDQEYIQEHILSRFWSGNNTRILLARRDEDIISHPILSWNDDPVRLPGFVEKQKQEQVQLRASFKPLAEFDLKQISEAFAPFASSNPFINAFLFECFITNAPHEITTAEIDACLMAIVERAGLKSSHIKLIKEIAKLLPEEWTTRELRENLNISLEDSDLEDLFKAGIVYQITGTASYKMEDGLYGLLS